MRRRATKEDLLNYFSIGEYKTIPQVRKEFEDDGLTPGVYFKGPVYHLLSQWASQGLIETRERSPEDHVRIDGHVIVFTQKGLVKAISLPLPEGSPNCLPEYRKSA